MKLDAYARHRDEIAGMLDERFHPMWWVDRQVWMGAIHTLGNDTAVIGFEIRVYPGGARELHGMFAAGELEGVLPLIDEATALAREWNMTVFTVASREGWARVLKSRGFDPHQVTIMKELG